MGRKCSVPSASIAQPQLPDFKVWYPTSGLTVDQYEQHYNAAQDFLNKYFVKGGG